MGKSRYNEHDILRAFFMDTIHLIHRSLTVIPDILNLGGEKYG
jgi:hypothetical protein